MSVRTTRSTILFAAPFRLPDFDGPLPAGEYQVDTDEEAFEGTSRTGYRRVGTTLSVRSGGRIEHHPVDPKDLEDALEKDRVAGLARADLATSLAGTLPPPQVSQSTWQGASGHPDCRWLPRWLRAFRPGRKG